MTMTGPCSTAMRITIAGAIPTSCIKRSFTRAPYHEARVHRRFIFGKVPCVSARREFQEIVGDAARARRQALGLRQDEVAWRCGLAGFAVTRSVVDAIERGARQLELPELLSLLAALDMSLADLLGGAGEVAQSGDLSVNGDVLLKQALGESPTWTITEPRIRPHLQRPTSNGPRHRPRLA